MKLLLFEEETEGEDCVPTPLRCCCGGGGSMCGGGGCGFWYVVRVLRSSCCGNSSGRIAADADADLEEEDENVDEEKGNDDGEATYPLRASSPFLFCIVIIVLVIRVEDGGSNKDAGISCGGFRLIPVVVVFR